MIFCIQTIFTLSQTFITYLFIYKVLTILITQTSLASIWRRFTSSKSFILTITILHTSYTLISCCIAYWLRNIISTLWVNFTLTTFSTWQTSFLIRKLSTDRVIIITTWTTYQRIASRIINSITFRFKASCTLLASSITSIS